MKISKAKLAARMATVCVLLAMIAPVTGAGERDHSRAGLRNLAAELAERFGQESIELRAGERAVAISRVGERADSPPAHLPTRIAPSEIVRAMNRERSAYGLRPLEPDARLSLAAGDRIRDMVKLHYFSHVSPDGREPFEAILERGFDFTEAGENLAVGFDSARRVVAAWMKSPAHRANLLSARFERVGVAITSNAPVKGMRGHLFVALYGAE